jgi:hypothetical protein
MIAESLTPKPGMREKHRPTAVSAKLFLGASASIVGHPEDVELTKVKQTLTLTLAWYHDQNLTRIPT